jgi:hypothetical protein
MNEIVAMFVAIEHGAIDIKIPSIRLIIKLKHFSLKKPEVFDI